MADEILKRKDLKERLNNVSYESFIRAAEKLGFVLTQASGGTSHRAIRLEGYDRTDIKGLVTTIYPHIPKQAKIKVVKAFVERGRVAEDDIWRTLGLLK